MPSSGRKAKPPCISAEHHRFDAGRHGVPQRKIAVAAAGILYKVCDLAAQRQGRTGCRWHPAAFLHNWLRAETVITSAIVRPPVLPGSKRRWRCRWNTVRVRNTPAGGVAAPMLRMMSLLITPPAQTTSKPGIFLLSRFGHLDHGIRHAEQAVLADIGRAFCQLSSRALHWFSSPERLHSMPRHAGFRLYRHQCTCPRPDERPRRQPGIQSPA